MAERKSRRRFLAEGALALAGVAVAGTQEAAAAPDAGVAAASGSASIFSGTPGAVTAPAGPPLTSGTFVEAEKLMRVTLTPEQRTQAAESWDGNFGAFFDRRKFKLDDDDVPAMVWNPVLKGTGRMPKQNKVVRSASTARKPPGDEDLAFAPVHLLSRWVQGRQISSVRLTELALARLERYQGQLNCTITLVRESALEQAADADREIAQGKYRGPLHGIPFGVKDLLDTAGIRTTWGAEPFRNRVPKQDATVVARLKAAGGILVAKLSLGALALNDVWYGGRTSNPWLLEEGSGGSSAGSGSSVGAGLVPFAIGSETYGSIVDPSDKCGVTGLRPDVRPGAADRGDDPVLEPRQAGTDGPLGGGHRAGAGGDQRAGSGGPLLAAEQVRLRCHPRGEGAQARRGPGVDERGAGDRGGPGRGGDAPQGRHGGGGAHLPALPLGMPAEPGARRLRRPPSRS